MWLYIISVIDEATELNESEHLEEIEDLEDRFSGNVDDGKYSVFNGS